MAIYSQMSLNNLNQKFNMFKSQRTRESKSLAKTHSSVANMLLKLQDNFLERFFTYNLNDYFQSYLSNLYGHGVFKTKSDQTLASSLFSTESNFSLRQFQSRINRFYSKRSKSILNQELPYAFKLCYQKHLERDTQLKKDELVFMKVKVKADVEKIENYPLTMLQSLKQLDDNKKSHFSHLQKYIQGYNGEYINAFYVVFGDANEQIFNKRAYGIDRVRVMGKELKVRYAVFYISRQSLLQTFGSLNKVPNLQQINDIMIQFYELKRAKLKKKRENLKLKDAGAGISRETVYKAIGITSLLATGFLALNMCLNEPGGLKRLFF